LATSPGLRGFAAFFIVSSMVFSFSAIVPSFCQGEDALR
jgi:hypothetical protein